MSKLNRMLLSALAGFVGVGIMVGVSQYTGWRSNALNGASGFVLLLLTWIATGNVQPSTPNSSSETTGQNQRSKDSARHPLVLVLIAGVFTVAAALAFGGRYTMSTSNGIVVLDRWTGEVSRCSTNRGCLPLRAKLDFSDLAMDPNQ